jgi:hypothetical protein
MRMLAFKRPSCRAVETAAQDNQVLRTAEGVGFNTLLQDRAGHLSPRGSVRKSHPTWFL